MYVLKNGTASNRLGITVSKKVGNSVVRHRVKRLVKEGYRLQEAAYAQGYDIVIVARPSAAGCALADAQAALQKLGKKLHIRES